MNRLSLLASAFAFLATPVCASMTATQHVEKEVVVSNADGVVTVNRVAADKVTPGETVIYSIRYRNDAAKAASNIVLVMPVPTEVAYVEGSVSGDDSSVAFSADGGKTYVARGRLTVVEDGASRPARGDEITHIRWTLTTPVPPKGEGDVSYKAILK